MKSIFTELGCRKKVTRAYLEMLESGASSQGAFKVALRVFCYHNPWQSPENAAGTIEQWLNVHVLH